MIPLRWWSSAVRAMNILGGHAEDVESLLYLRFRRAYNGNDGVDKRICDA